LFTGRRNNYKVDPNQELLALGLANVLGSFVSAYPITASFSRSAVNGQSGVRTPAGNFVTGIMVVLVLAFATSLFYYIPKSALAAIIIVAVSDLFDYTPLIEMWHTKKIDLIPWVGTYIMALVFSIEIGLVCGTILSLLILLYPASRPGMEIKHEGEYTVMKLNQGFVYPSVEYFKDHITDKVLAEPTSSPDVRRALILDFLHVSNIDSSVAECLHNLAIDYSKKKALLVLCNVRDHIRHALDECDVVLLAEDLNDAILMVTAGQQMTVANTYHYITGSTVEKLKRAEKEANEEATTTTSIYSVKDTTSESGLQEDDVSDDCENNEEDNNNTYHM